MKAILVRAPMAFGLEEVPRPECPAGGLLLQVHACGLCGSDLRTLRSGHRKVVFPWIIGHEIGGVVAETGSRYEGRWRVGDRLSVAPLVYCGTCDFCQNGQYELCEGYREIAQAWPGGFAEYLAIPEEAIRRGTIQAAPEGLDLEQAAIAEPVSSCLHAQEEGRVGLGDTVVVIGTGPVGCIHIALARARGAKMVIAVDLSETRLAQAARFQPDHIVDARRGDLKDEIRKLTGGRGAEVIITANPAPEAQVQAVEIARKGGRILLFGGLPKTESCPRIDMNLVHYNALHLMGTTIFAPRHHRQALQLLADGRIDGNLLITHRGRLEDFPAIAAAALAGEVCKAVLHPCQSENGEKGTFSFFTQQPEGEKGTFSFSAPPPAPGTQGNEKSRMSPFPITNIAQICVIVPDLDKAVENYWQVFGIGPWEFYTYGKPLVKRMTRHGRPCEYRMRVALANVGGLRIELIEPLEGDTVYREFVEKHGYGIHHVGVLTESMAQALNQAQQAGLTMTQDGAGFGPDDDGHYAYLDTEALIGTTIELIERPQRRNPPEKVYPAND